MQTTVTHVLVHGFAGAAESWRAVPLNGHVVALTMPGHGDEPVRSNGFDGYVDWLLAAISGLGPVHLVGYSAGGRVVLGALARGARVAATSLISTGFGGATADERASRAETDAAWSSLLRTQGMSAFVAAWESQPLFTSQRSAAPELIAAQRALRLRLSSDALADAMDALSVARMPDLSATVTNYPGRLQLIVGALDTKYVALAHSLEVRSGRVIELTGCGHNPLIEAPEALGRALEEFVVTSA